MDIDANCTPHIVAPMTEMGDIGPFDAIYSSHALEHLYPHDVGMALSEFVRVLKPGGHAIIFVPDIEGVEPTEEPLYVSPAGPICGRDIIYGKASFLAENPYMAHKTGFVRATLEDAIKRAGFGRHEVRRVSGYNILAIAVRD